MNYKYYKKIDRSMMDWGFTLPKESIDYFDPGRKIEPGSQIDVEIIWDKKVYNMLNWHMLAEKLVEFIS